LDPAHLPFTHEGTLAKRSDAQRMDMDVIWNTLTRNIEKDDDSDYAGCQSIGQRGFKVIAYTPNDPTKNIGNFSKLHFIFVFIIITTITHHIMIYTDTPVDRN
jgi:hypothetical protein